MSWFRNMRINKIMNNLNSDARRRGAGIPWKSRKGSAVTEAAMLLPVYIMAVVTLICLIKICWVDVIFFSAAENRIREASVQEISAICSSIKADAEKAGLNKDGADAYSLPGADAGYGIDSLENIYFSYDTKVGLPAPFGGKSSVKNMLVSRKWTGRLISGEAFGFERMEIDEDGTLVSVFPRAGGKYHGTGCRYVNSYAQEKILNDEIRAKYKACPRCTDGNEKNGKKVYIFKYGGAYHNADCDSVEKYVIEMDKADALLKNYTPCSVCGGN